MEIAMARLHFLPIVAIATVLFTIGEYGIAQQDKNPPGGIKPAQAGSPAANPANPAGPNINAPANAEPRTAVRERTQTIERRTDQTIRDRGSMNLDRQLAACLLNANKAEVELGKFASDHATS